MAKVGEMRYQVHSQAKRIWHETASSRSHMTLRAQENRVRHLGVCRPVLAEPRPAVNRRRRVGLSRRSSVSHWVARTLAIFILVGCSDPSGLQEQVGGPAECTIDTRFIFDTGVPRDGIPALTDPPFVRADHPTVSYLKPEDRVVGFLLGDRALAVPHNVLWWHEIVNLNSDDIGLAVTYCPLTGSSIIFDRSVVDGAEFGVSGLIFNNNLMMYDRRDRSSLWPQMYQRAGCGPELGRRLPTFPAIDIQWQGWLKLHPNTLVVGGSIEPRRPYDLYPYGDYESDPNFQVAMPFVDNRLFPKKRVLGLPRAGFAGAGVAFPLDISEPWRVASLHYDGSSAVVFWDSEKSAVVALRPLAEGQELEFEAGLSGIFDLQTGSRWTVDGRAVDGPLAGAELEIIPEAYMAFWGAWSVFEEDTLLWD